ncbi:MULTISPECIES: TetR/AcrR family transcriptional regulator [Streptomyces]|uniref:TetR/AcrR family transcriptional regulator n=1 Tax=Streptomyces benahoarensis TaxID=2595054 RepID=A0A553ZRW2_9ACTN|nr:TetR/AcrR family transcriptional regulator [Streptomyces benahoarensis]TSB32636.1 TetR/AcrR family transcriptional regulator [Streptomyces benahoarensis]TSB44192.1 TetR/AcrR family transcriptional regulator [Streptomyces benahoarensis]
MTGTQEARRRDSARSREALLRAASELFSERGFDRTTTRDIGRRAGVDPALIARYFGGKTQLYLAAVEAERGDAPVSDLLAPDRLRQVLEGAARRGLVPILQVGVQPLSDPEADAAARAALHDRLVEPLHRRFVAEGRAQPRLRAEIVVAAVIGIVLGRSSGAFEELGEVASDDLAALLQETLRGGE